MTVPELGLVTENIKVRPINYINIDVSVPKPETKQLLKFAKRFGITRMD